MFYYENENKHWVSMTTKLIITVLLQYWRDYMSECSYRHPGVRQDLLSSETGIHIHLQHLTYQHLRTRSCNSYQFAVHRTNVLLTRSHCCISCYVPLLYVVSLFTLSCWIASNFEMVKYQTMYLLFANFMNGTFAGRLMVSQSGDGNSSFPLRIWSNSSSWTLFSLRKSKNQEKLFINVTKMMVGHMIPKQYKRQDCVNTTN